MYFIVIYNIGLDKLKMKPQKNLKLLELFSGTHSIGKVALPRNIEVISLDRDMGGLETADKKKVSVHIKEDIMTWDYKVYPEGYFDIITASPVCLYWSALRNCWIGRKSKTINPDGSIVTRECLERDINTYGKPMVDKVFEILEYFKPNWWWIENPQTGKMKRYIEEIKPEVHWVDVDYCKYGFTYRKRTRFWLSDTLKEFEPKLCKKDCDAMTEGIHKTVTAGGYVVNEIGKRELCNTKKLRYKYKEKIKNNPKLKHKSDISIIGGSTTKLERYRIPEKLIEELLNLTE